MIIGGFHDLNGRVSVFDSIIISIGEEHCLDSTVDVLDGAHRRLPVSRSYLSLSFEEQMMMIVILSFVCYRTAVGIFQKSF
jgi:hypothetical protein